MNWADFSNNDNVKNDIQSKKREMTFKERFLTVVNHNTPDEIPVDIMGFQGGISWASSGLSSCGFARRSFA